MDFCFFCLPGTSTKKDKRTTWRSLAEKKNVFLHSGTKSFKLLYKNMLSSREFLKHHILHTNDRIEIS